MKLKPISLVIAILGISHAHAGVLRFAGKQTAKVAHVAGHAVKKTAHVAKKVLY